MGTDNKHPPQRETSTPGRQQHAEELRGQRQARDEKRVSEDPKKMPVSQPEKQHR